MNVGLGLSRRISMPASREGRRDALAQLARRRPAVGGADRTEDLEGHTFAGQRGHPVDPGRLQDAAFPGRIGGHLATDLVDDARGRLEIRPVGDGQVEVDAGPHPGQVAGHADQPVGHRVDRPVQVAKGRPAEREVLDRAGDVSDAHDIALRVLVLDEDEGPGEIVADEVLGSQAHGEADDAQGGDGGPDIEMEGLHAHQEGDGQDDHAEQGRDEALERRLTLCDLDRRELLSGPFRHLAIEQGGDDGPHPDPGEAQGEQRGQEDEQELEADGEQGPAGRAERLVEAGDVHRRLA